MTFLGHPDGAVAASLDLRRDITRVIRRVRPDRVLTWSPEINWELVPTAHPDHRAVGEATFAAVYPDARNPHAFPELLAEGLRPWTVRELWLADAPAWLRNHVVDVTDAFDQRLAALRERTLAGSRHNRPGELRSARAGRAGPPARTTRGSAGRRVPGGRHSLIMRS